MGEDLLMVKKKAAISSNKCQLKQWDIRSACYNAWKAYFSTCLPSCIPQLLNACLWNCFLLSNLHRGPESMSRFLSQLPAILSQLCYASSFAAAHGPSWLRFLPEHQQDLHELLQSPLQPPVGAGSFHALNVPVCLQELGRKPWWSRPLLTCVTYMYTWVVTAMVISLLSARFPLPWLWSGTTEEDAENCKNCNDKQQHTKHPRREDSFKSLLFPKVYALYRLRFNNILWWVPQLHFESFSPWWLTLLQQICVLWHSHRTWLRLLMCCRSLLSCLELLLRRFGGVL